MNSLNSFILCFLYVFTIVRGRSYIFESACGKTLAVGETIMGATAVLDPTVTISVVRSIFFPVQSGSFYFAGETLSVFLSSSTATEYAFTVASGRARFSNVAYYTDYNSNNDGCNGQRVSSYSSLAPSILMPSAGNVVIRAAFANAYGTLSVTPDFILNGIFSDDFADDTVTDDVDDFIPPSQLPTALPTVAASLPPTLTPSLLPTDIPTGPPVVTATGVPSVLPSVSPSVSPTLLSTVLLTSMSPSASPTVILSDLPTSVMPTNIPSLLSTGMPSSLPVSLTPTATPSASQSSIMPVMSPTQYPSMLNAPLLTFDVTMLITGYTGSLTTTHLLVDKDRQTVTDTIAFSASLLSTSCELTTADAVDTTTHRVIVQVKAHLIDFPQYQNNATSLYIDLKTMLITTYTLGTMNTLLHNYALTYTANDLSTATITSLSISEPNVTNPGDNEDETVTSSSSGSEKSQPIGTAAIVGIVIGSFLFLVLANLIFCFCREIKE